MTLQTTESVSALRYLKGIGPKRALALERIGVHSLRDLFYFFPRRYEDRSHFADIAKLEPGMTATVRAEVLGMAVRPLKRIRLFELTVGDASGMIRAVWFNQPYLKNQFATGQQVILYGKAEWYQNRLQITSPEYEVLEGDEESVHTGRITPIYPLTEGLFQKSLRTVLKDAVQTQLDKTIRETYPEDFLMQHGLMPLPQAVYAMHFPENMETLERARHRIVFDEFFVFFLTLFKKIKRARTQHRSRPYADTGELAAVFARSLPFELTSGQREAIRSIQDDFAKPHPMNRILQGDVGSGKTVVAAFAFLATARSGHQGAMLVPTEILAEQHYRTVRTILKNFDVAAGLLTSSTPPAVRERMLAELKQGKLSLLIGTHALLQDDVRFKSLALVVVDEQHKFGVRQRSKLLHQEPRPHQLVMTATPIPRTLALTVYGDLDKSIMKEMPRGRKPVKTCWITRKKQPQVLARIRDKVKQGEQAYFIFPLIEETEKSDLLAAEKEYQRLKKGVFSDLKVGLVHGQISNEERDETMKRFSRGELQVLVATSVVEVGVDNPNASLMVIENAERFGLAQLHQMRGRIGRGSRESECFLFGEPKQPEGKMRLRILTKSQDGFVIAEEDLKLRGPGDFWGTRQSGAPLFRVANPATDQDLFLTVRQIASELVREGVLEQAAPWEPFRKELQEQSLKY